MVLLRFLVASVLAATTAEFAELQPVRRCLLVLGRNVVPTLTIGTLKHNIIAWHKLFPISDCQLPILSTAVRLLKIGTRQSAIGNAFTRSLLKRCRLRPCGRLHEWRSAIPFPWRLAQSARSTSARCPPASPSPRLPASAP